jgi:hypothetical protein
LILCQLQSDFTNQITQIYGEINLKFNLLIFFQINIHIHSCSRVKMLRPGSRIFHFQVHNIACQIHSQCIYQSSQYAWQRAEAQIRTYLHSVTVHEILFQDFEHFSQYKLRP